MNAKSPGRVLPRAVAVLLVTTFGCAGGTPGTSGTGGRGSTAGTGGATGSGGATTGSGGTTGATGGSGGGTIGTGGGDAGSGGTAGVGSGGTSTGGSTGTGSGGTGSGGATGGAGRGGSTGGAGAGGSATGGVSGSGGGGGVGGAAGTRAASVTKDGESRVTSAGLTIVSYGGYLNGEAFQQEGIFSHRGFQYAAFWNTARHVVLARRELPSGTWSTIEFTDYRNSADDAHNTISIGVTPGDGTLHLAFDHHGNDLHYRRSMPGLLNAADGVPWATSSFSSVTSALVGSTRIALVTYPRFITAPGGNQMLLSARIGESGSGDEYLWEYDGATHAWKSLGKYLDGISDSVNAYLHGIAYTPGGTRLHAAWCWRETPDATTNHDLFYLYSDDHGRNWRDNAGTIVATAGSRFVTKSSSSARVWTIAQNRGLINQEHMTVDSSGAVHVLLSHMPDAQASDSNFTSARTKSQYFHYWRNPSGMWTRGAIAGLKVVANLRGHLAISSTRNVYAVLPDLRIAGASAAANYADWALLNSTDSGRFFSDPLIDAARLLSEDKLTVYYPQKSSGNIYALDYTIR